MHAEADEVVCLEMPAFFMAVGLHYADFSQTEDQDVERILHAWTTPAHAAMP
jgi:putative phosphoribosyl transferase